LVDFVLYNGCLYNSEKYNMVGFTKTTWMKKHPHVYGERDEEKRSLNSKALRITNTGANIYITFPWSSPHCCWLMQYTIFYDVNVRAHGRYWSGTTSAPAWRPRLDVRAAVSMLAPASYARA
jgi:hypothetical protein